MSTHPHPHPHPPSPGGLHPHHGPMNHHPQVNGHMPVGSQAGNSTASTTRVTQLNEEIWLQIGGLTEMMGDLDGAMQAYEQALRCNQWSIRAMNGISAILRTREMFPKAVEYLLSISKLDPTNGETWGSLGHCYLMMDDLQQAYSSYQQALYHLPDPKEPKLWYGIGILYDRYGSLEHAEEAFSQVMHMAPDFEKANEIYFRLGIIYKQQTKFSESLECFKYIVNDPPRPLTEEDIWFQIGHVHEQQKDYDAAKAAYRRVLEREPNHAKVLQQLGWLHHQQSSSYNSQEQAIEYLEKSVSADNSDAQSWYLLGRCYMSQAKYPKAYEAYQQAVYRDGRNPTFWCSIGVLYYQINQYRDALDAYSRAIRLNPYISEVWYDLGTLYESCNNQTSDALDAYTRAAELDPSNVHIKARLQLLRNGQATGINQANAPVPHDVHPQAYQAAGVGAPPGPPGPQWGAPAPAPAPPVPGPPPSGRIGDWARGISDIQPPHPPNPYDQRDGLRGPPPPPPPPPRQPSPRQDPMRPYAEPHRHTPVRKGLSPSPKINQTAPTPYSGPQTLPQLGSHTQQPAPPPPQQPQQPQRGLMVNPNFSSVAPAGASSASTNPPSTGPLPSFSNRPFSPGPVPEIRPIIDDRTSSPGSSYQHQQYQHHPNTSVPSGIASGAPAPAAAMAAAEAAARERDDRPASAAPGPKRVREWEGESAPVKKHATEETKARLDDHVSRRISPPGQIPSPAELHRRSSSEIRRENERRANDNYHPSEAAHHPPSLPSMHVPQHLPPMNEAPKDERKEQIEPAARKMDVDEDYDKDSDDEKRGTGSGARNSPPNGITNGQAKQEVPT